MGKEPTEKRDEREPWRLQSAILFLITLVFTFGLLVVAGHLGLPGEHPLEVGGWCLPSGWFIALHLGLLISSLTAVLTFPRALGRRRAWIVIVVIALGVRALLLPRPASDDVNRYIWEGRALAEGFSPYRHAPRDSNDPAVDHLRNADDPIWRGINHPEYTAIYPPLMLALLSGLTSIAPDPLNIKIAMTLFDLGTLLLILLILEGRSLNRRWALLYGLNPVVCFAFAGEGHNDAVQVFALVAAVLAHDRRRWGWMWLALGLAVSAKYVAIVVWPFFLTRESWKQLWLGMLLALGPIGLTLAIDGTAIFDSLLAFGLEMSFNGPIHGILRWLTGSSELTNPIAHGLFLVLFSVGFMLLRPSRRSSTGTDPTSGAFFALALFLLLSPTVHFWYLSWLVPFLALRPKASWLLLTGTLAFTYVPYGLEIQTGTWSFPWWGMPLIWSGLFVLLALELWRWWSRHQRRKWANWNSVDAELGVSVVIPTFDEAARIRECLDSVTGERRVREIIVVDGGSTDDTVELAENQSAMVRPLVHEAPFDAGGGRGGQIARGVEEARAEVVLVLHADTKLAPGSIEELCRRLEANPELSGGALGASFDGEGWGLRILELANDFRAAYLGIAFGDQVQFFRRGIGSTEDGRFPAIPLMEDVELNLLLHRFGRTTFHWGTCEVSPRKWTTGGALGRVRLVIGLTSEYLLRRLFGRTDTVEMYRRYYRRG